MGKRLDHRVEPPCINKLCRVPPSLSQPAIFHLPRRLLLGNLGELKCRPFFIFICKRRNQNIINLNWLNVFCFQIRCHNRQDQDFNSRDFNRAYLQYCKCCTFYFVIQLLSEPGKKKNRSCLFNVYSCQSRITIIYYRNKFFPQSQCKECARLLFLAFDSFSHHNQQQHQCSLV